MYLLKRKNLLLFFFLLLLLFPAAAWSLDAEEGGKPRKAGVRFSGRLNRRQLQAEK